MKKIVLTLSLVVFLFGFVGCEKTPVETKGMPQTYSTSIFDSLQGRWLHFAQDGAWAMGLMYYGENTNDKPTYKCILEFTKQVSDTTMEYNYYRNDSLKSSGVVAIVKTEWWDDWGSEKYAVRGMQQIDCNESLSSWIFQDNIPLKFEFKHEDVANDASPWYDVVSYSDVLWKYIDFRNFSKDGKIVNYLTIDCEPPIPSDMADYGKTNILVKQGGI